MTKKKIAHKEISANCTKNKEIIKIQRLDITRHYNIHMLIKTNVIFIYKSKDCVKRHRNVIIFNEIISHNCVCLSTIQVNLLPNI